MKLNFVIDRNYLIVHILSWYGYMEGIPSQKYKKDLVAFQNYAWGKSPKFVRFLSGWWRPGELTSKNLNLFRKIGSFLKKLERSNKFRKILLQTERYLEICRTQWEKNYILTNKIVRELTGLKLDKNFTVYITHPSLFRGSYLGKNNLIFGNHEKWPNYSTVYLWHEILHSYFIDNELNHAIIELIADNEIRSRLNNTKYPPFEGHKSLIPIKQKLLPYWKKYLKSEKKDIKKFYRDMSKKITITKRKK